MNTITLPRSVVEQALSTLEGWSNYDKWVWHESALSTAKQNTAEIVPTLRAALEQPQVEQEPVAYYVMNGSALFQLFRSKSQADALAYDLQKRHDLSGSLAHFHVVPLYTHPQPKREPLTDEEIKIIDDGVHFHEAPDWSLRFARAIEAAHGVKGRK